uniref:Hexosyltransferase n=1 Tax=Glossina brevipalpis TaxID=37001 RepID=A0A1A9WP13_9MUSC
MRIQKGKYILLPLNSNSSNSTQDSSDEDDEGSAKAQADFLKRSDKFRAKVNVALRGYKPRRCYHTPCKLGKRLVCCVLVAFMVTWLLFLVLMDFSARHYALSDWSFEASRNMADYILPNNVTTLLEPRHVCQDKVFLLIMVCSRMSNFVLRQTIRETWGNTTEFNYGQFEQLHAHLKDKYFPVKKQRLEFYKDYLRLHGNQTTTNLPPNLPVRILFLVGRNRDEQLESNETLWRIRQEADQYDDIIQENFIDTYNNLTVKAVMSLKWVINNGCYQKAAFFMKCDDDTFVNVPNLLHFLLGGTIPLYNDTLDFYDQRSIKLLYMSAGRLKATDEYLVGHKFCSVRPIENVASKWYMPSYMYPGDKYPTYLSGAGYLMSMDVVPKLYMAALNTSLIHLEDVYLTGMCAQRAHVRRIHHPLFNYKSSKKLCTFKGVIICHGLKEENMYLAYNAVTNISNRCSPPGKYYKFIRLQKNNDCD